MNWKKKRLIEEKEATLSIVCAGSVFKSWQLIKSGFVRGISIPNDKIKRLRLLTIRKDASIGASILAAKFSNADSNKILSKNRDEFIDQLDAIKIFWKLTFEVVYGWCIVFLYRNKNKRLKYGLMLYKTPEMKLNYVCLNIYEIHW